MYRNLKQKLLLSFIPPARIKRFIDNPELFTQVFKIKNHHVIVKDSVRLSDFTDYSVLAKFNNDEQIYIYLMEQHKDYNSNFKEYFGITLDDYEQKKIKS